MFSAPYTDRASFRLYPLLAMPFLRLIPALRHSLAAPSPSFSSAISFSFAHQSGVVMATREACVLRRSRTGGVGVVESRGPLGQSWSGIYRGGQRRSTNTTAMVRPRW
ncbi:hypothetical protein B0J15DRAFT_30472 [Fusarium solani]|uniref:Uncharacterized protein n=1 Tax=Fusarium solani TaxID=169388 RepID=A0A9P9L8R8_FUSSL|nr:uncharacterized protein B0J15DRAFT_30472 [Fusarium solani]KAH7275988.1 hypothetical protein B0J15DRAFT_30472 [Fusarium solani]